MDKPLPENAATFLDQAQYQSIVETMLEYAKQKGATQAQVDASFSVGLNVTVRHQEIETLEFNRDKAIDITVYIGKRKGSASTTDIHPDSLRTTVDAAISFANLTQEDTYSGLVDSDLMAKDVIACDLYHPWSLSVLDAIEYAKRCEQAALNFDKRISNSDGANLSSVQGYHLYGNTHGFMGSNLGSRHGISCTMVAEDKNVMERDYDYTTARDHKNLVDPSLIGERAAKRAVERLGAVKIATQRSPIILSSNLAAGFIAQFIAAINGNRLYRQMTFLLESLGEKVFPDFVHIYEDPLIKGGLGSTSFDQDGVQTTKKHFVESGTVKNYVLNGYSARKLGMKTTGNAGGVHNLLVSHSDQTLEQLLRQMDKGLLVTELMGQGINLVTGDYSRGAFGFWIENGKIQYPVHEITIAGNLKDMFQGIQQIGNDLDRRRNIQSGSILIDSMMIAGK